METLENTIKYTFKNKELLKTALIHKSYLNSNKTKDESCNERLEFLGDSVLGFVTAEYLYKNYPLKDEGEMSKIRSIVVCEDSLAKIAKDWNLGKYLYMSGGEKKSGGCERASILSDAVESVIAAVFLDSDFETAKKFVLSFFAHLIDENQTENSDNKNYKTALQEFCQQNEKSVSYKLIKVTGPDHDRTYSVCAVVDGKQYKSAEAKSKKKAEQHAAKAAFKALAPDKKEV